MLVLTDYTPEKYGKTIRAARNTYIAVEQFEIQAQRSNTATVISTQLQ